MTGALAPARSGPSIAPRTLPRSRGDARPGWAAAYLALCALLVPLVQPGGPSQTAIVDALNLVALGLFAIHVLASHRAVRLPYASALMFVVAGSLIATTDAESVGQSVLAMVQEVYLYLWFVMLVDLTADPDDHRRARVLWVGTAILFAVVALVQLEIASPGALMHLATARGLRSSGTFTNPNMLADYSVLALLMIPSVAYHMPRLVRWAGIGLLLVTLVSTKSNGGLLMLAVGGLTWLIVRILTRRGSGGAMIGGFITLAGAAGFALWLVSSSGIVSQDVRSLRQHSFLGRASHSTESRSAIWMELLRHYPEHPLGIGPGNSKYQQLEIGKRERPDSFMGKTSHNDYLGFLVERGPLGLLGLLMLLVLPIVAVARAWRSSRDSVWLAGEGGAVAASLIAVVMASGFHSIMIEKVHFRHYWFLLAMTASFRPPPARAARPVPAAPPLT